MIRNFIFLLLLLIAWNKPLSCQNYRWDRSRILTGSAWSFDQGDEYLYLGFHIPITQKFHAGLSFGYRPQEIKTLQFGVTAGYGLITIGPHRLYGKTDLSFFYRKGGIIFDDRYFRHSYGLGYITSIYERLFIVAEVNLVGFYYGTRKDRYQNPTYPSMYDAGELKLGAGFRF